MAGRGGTFATMQLRGRTRTLGDATIAELDGDADLASAPQLTQLLARAIDQAAGDGAGGTRVVVDLDGLAVVDDVALGLLLGAAATARRRNTSLGLLCTNERRRARLADTRVDRAIDVIDTVDAIDAVGADPIFHLAMADDWEAAQRTGTYTTSTRGRSIDDEGFVHCSFAHQIRSVVERFYADVDEVVIVHLDRRALAADLRIEPAADGVDERFPHLYRPIPLDAVTATTRWWTRGDSWGEPPVG